MANEHSNPVGRPAFFNSPEELQAKIDEFFTSGEKATITGLALWLGFCDRQSLYDYQEKPEFTCIIKTARLRVENQYEKNLTNKELQPTGSIFALKNMGWSDRTATDITTNGKEISISPIQWVNSENTDGGQA